MTTNHPQPPAFAASSEASSQASVDASVDTSIDTEGVPSVAKSTDNSTETSTETSTQPHPIANAEPTAAPNANANGSSSSSVSALSVIGRAAEAEVDPAQDWLVAAYHEAQTQDARRPGSRVRAAVHAQAVALALALARTPRGAALPPVAKASRVADTRRPRMNWKGPVFASIVMVGLTGWLLVPFDRVSLDELNRWAGRAADMPVVLAGLASGTSAATVPLSAPLPASGQKAVAATAPIALTKAQASRASPALDSSPAPALRKLPDAARASAANGSLPGASAAPASLNNPPRPAVARAPAFAVAAAPTPTPPVLVPIPSTLTTPLKPPASRAAPEAAVSSIHIAAAPARPAAATTSPTPRPAEARAPDTAARRALASARATSTASPSSAASATSATLPRRPANSVVVAAVTPSTRPPLLRAVPAPRPAVLADATADLLRAARNGSAAELEEALARGASINAPDGSGRTALILAAANGHPRVVRRLLAAGVNAALVDRSGLDAMEHARQNQSESAALLIRAMR